MSDLVQLSVDGDVATMTLNRPERHNSLVPELPEELPAPLERLRARPGLRAAVPPAQRPAQLPHEANQLGVPVGRELVGHAEGELARAPVALDHLSDLPADIIRPERGRE